MNNYFTPTKEHPVFEIHDSDYGPINIGTYKDWRVMSDKFDYKSTGFTAATNYIEAVNNLNIAMSTYPADASPRTTLTLYMIDGSIDTIYKTVRRKKVHAINVGHALKVGLIKK